MSESEYFPFHHRDGESDPDQKIKYYILGAGLQSSVGTDLCRPVMRLLT
jgi:hypothetical protein